MSLDPVTPPSPFERFGRLGAIIALIVLAGVAVVGGASFLGRRVGQTINSGTGGAGGAVTPGIDVEVVVPSGASAKEIAAILAAQGVIESASQFETVVRAAGASADLRAGTYQFVTGMEPSHVLDLLREGPAADTLRVTIPEGLRVVEIVARLAEATGRPESDFTTALESNAVITSLRKMGKSSALTDWEGLLFPDTYQVAKTEEPASILQRMADTMARKVNQVDWSRLEKAGYDRYEGIIIASLIESEVRVADERPLVSSVIANRLAADMPLQIDATVLYALGTRIAQEFDSSIDSPYNTYRVKGLPPTPISAPGLASLKAAAAPADTEYLYYVLSSKDGSHTFSTNLEDHNAAVQKARQEGILP
ncbi:MAG: endolytic transglycosylase MltG [Acidimicrobiia bacterium]